MKRWHLIEIHEQSWCPRVLRDALRAGLELTASKSSIYDGICEELLGAIERTGDRKVLDLCSGRGGPWSRMFEIMRDDPRLDGVVLTDLYPDPEAIEELSRRSGGFVTGHSESVNALNVDTKLEGFRTIFTAFHHFQPDEAESILRDAVDSGRGIAVFEFTERRLSIILITVVASFASAFVLIPFVSGFRWSFAFYTYLIPLIPLITTIDAVVSCLRTYNPDELLAMATRAGSSYDWKAGRRRVPGSPLFVTYLIGVPEER